MHCRCSLLHLGHWCHPTCCRWRCGDRPVNHNSSSRRCCRRDAHWPHSCRSRCYRHDVHRCDGADSSHDNGGDDSRGGSNRSNMVSTDNNKASTSSNPNTHSIPNRFSNRDDSQSLCRHSGNNPNKRGRSCLHKRRCCHHSCNNRHNNLSTTMPACRNA